MKQPPRQRPVKDERDEQIGLQAKSHSLEYVIAATQILTIMCLIKGNPAWKGSLSFYSLVWLLGCSISISNIQKNHIVKLVWSF